MFQNFIRNEEYLVTAAISIPGKTALETVNFKPGTLIHHDLETLQEMGGTIFCIKLNGTLHMSLTREFEGMPVEALLELKNRALKCESTPRIYVAGRFDTESDTWQMLKDLESDLPLVSLIRNGLDTYKSSAYLYRLAEDGCAYMQTRSEYVGDAATPLGNYQLNNEDIKSVQDALEHSNYVV